MVIYEPGIQIEFDGINTCGFSPKYSVVLSQVNPGSFHLAEK